MSFKNIVLVSVLLAIVLSFYVFDALKLVDFLASNHVANQQQLEQFKTNGEFGHRTLTNETAESLLPDAAMAASDVAPLDELVQPAVPSASPERDRCFASSLFSELSYQPLSGPRYQLQVDHFSPDQQPQMQQALQQRLDEVFEQYQQWLAVDNSDVLPVVPLRLVFLTADNRQRMSFERVLTEQGIDASQIQGIHFAQNQLSLVKVITTEQALNTAVHEAVHAINQVYFGHLPRFINEGIAEFFESNRATGDINGVESQAYVLPPWFDVASPYDDLLDFYTLLYSEEDWHTSNNRSLYFSGQVWFGFLLNSDVGQQALSQVLKTKYQSPCQQLTAQDIGNTLNELYPLFEQDFNYWFEQQVSARQQAQQEQ